mgnify:CR=1 FL=1
MDLRKVARLVTLADKASRRQAVRALSTLADLWSFHTLKQMGKKDPSRTIRELSKKALARCENGIVKRILKRIPEFKEASGHSYRLVERALHSVEAKVRCAGIRAAALAHNVGFISPIVELARQDHDERVVITALKALGILGGKREANEIVSFTNHKSAKVRTAAVLALSMIGNGSCWVLLVGLLSSQHEQLRNEALFFLGLLGEKQLNRVLSFMATSMDERLARAALEAAGVMGTNSSTVLLILLLRHEKKELRERARFFLQGRAEQGNEEAKQALVEVRATDDHTLKASKAILMNAAVEEDFEEGKDTGKGNELDRSELDRSELDASVELQPDKEVVKIKDELVEDEAHSVHDDDEHVDEEDFKRAKEKVLTQSQHLPQPKVVQELSLAQGASDLVISMIFGLGAILMYISAISLLALPLLLIAQTLQHCVGLSSIVAPLFLLLFLAWALLPARDRSFHSPLPQNRHPRLQKALKSIKKRMLPDYEVTVPQTVICPGRYVGLRRTSLLPLLPIGSGDKLVFGAMVLPFLSVQEMKVLLARSMVERSHDKGFLASFVRQLNDDLALLCQAYGCRSGLGHWINPTLWFFRLAQNVLLSLKGRSFRRAVSISDQAVAVKYGANIVVDAITQYEVMNVLLEELCCDLLDKRREMKVVPINFYGELVSSTEHIFVNKQKGVKGRVLAQKTALIADKPALKDRIDAISHGTPRRTRAHREVWWLLEGRTELEKKLTNIIWSKSRW